MAGLLNPSFGLVPGAPYGLHYWDGNRFVLADMLPPPPPPPPPPLAPTVTPQDVQAVQAVQQMRSDYQGGSDSGGAMGGATRDQTPDPSRSYGDYGFGNTSGKSNPDYGSIGSWAGLLGGLAVPGPGGMILGPAGNMIGNAVDVSRNNSRIGDAARQFGTNINPLGFGDWARGVVNDTLIGRALGFGRDPYMAAFNNIADAKTALGAQEAAAAEQAAAADKAAKQDMWGYDGMLNGSPSKTGDMLGPDYVGGVYGGGMDKGGPTPGGAMGIDPTGPGGFGSPGPGMDAGGYGPGAGAGPDAGGAYGPGFAKGGTVRPPAMAMMDPPGPDDQVAGLQTGEGVLTRAAMKRYPGLLDALNLGDTKRAIGLLGGIKGYWRGGQVQDPRAAPSWDPATGQKIEDSGLYVDPQTGLMEDENGRIYQPRPERPEWSQPRPGKLTPGRR